MELSIIKNLEIVRSDVVEAAKRAGRSPCDVQLVAVTKTHGPEAISEMVNAGQFILGENRVQEARSKMPLVSSRAQWHLIGHLQSNKIRQALPLFERIHSIDTLELALEVNRIARELGLFPKVLLEVNVAGENTKFGFTPDALRACMEKLLTLDRLAIDGLMTIPPFSDEPEATRPYFATLRELRDKLASEFRVPLPELSMGMSGDFAIAIEEGATFVRVGTAIFGTRIGKAWKPIFQA